MRFSLRGPLYPVTLDDLHAVEGSGLGEFHRVVCGVHHPLSDFIHRVVVHRQDEAIREWRNWPRKDPSLPVHPYKVASSRFDSPCSISSL